MCMYQGGHYKLLKDRIMAEWKGFSGHAFEEMVRTLLIQDLSGQFGHIGSWWNRRGDEIDFLALGETGILQLR